MSDAVAELGRSGGAAGRVVSCRRAPRRLGGVLGAAFAVAVLACGRPAAATPFPLAEAVARALASGPDAVIARLEAERAGLSVGAARSSYLPSLGVTSHAGYSNRQDEKLRAVDSDGVEREYGLASLGSERGWLNVFLRQLVVDLAAWRELRKSEIAAEAAEAAELEQREAVAFAVLESYVNALRLVRALALDEERVQSLKWLDDRGRVLLEEGRALPGERDRVSIQLAEARLDAELRRQAISQAHASLWRVTGVEDEEGKSLDLVGTVPDPDGPGEDPAGADDEAILAAAPELRLLGLRQRQEELDVAAARAKRFPTLAVEMGYTHYGTKRYDNFDDELVLGVDFALPLFDGLSSHYDIAGASREAEIARLRYRSMLERKRDRVRDLTRRLAAEAGRPALARRRAEAAAEAVRLVDLRLKSDRATLDEALAARAEHGRDAARALDAEYDRVLLWAAREREIGRLAARLRGAPASP